MNILYIDCFSGISGDMFLGALLDAGLPVDHLSAQLKTLGLPEFHGLQANKVRKGALVGTQLIFEFSAPLTDHHDHEHDVHHEHRNLADIQHLIEKSGLSGSVKSASVKIFQLLAQAEAKVHGVEVEEIHFHEVGATDSILDIVGAAIGMEFFQIDAVYSSPIPLGTGQVVTQHGLLPLPAPATLELIRLAQAPVTPSTATNEIVTPTGAAILAAFARFEQPEMKIDHIGIGAGQRDLDWPNVLRILIGSRLHLPTQYLEIETNIDDMNPQIFGYLMPKLFAAGALDVFLTPIYMKKNRPATKLSVITRDENEKGICDLIMRETSTLGMRIKSIRRAEAERRIDSVTTRFGSIPVKHKIINGEIVQSIPEFDVCAQAAEKHDIPLATVIKEIEAQVIHDQNKTENHE